VTDDKTRNHHRPIVTACLLGALIGAALLAAGHAEPASAGAPPPSTGSGGVGLTGTAPGTATVIPVGGALSTSSGGITLQSPKIALLRGTVSFTGTVTNVKPGETVTIQRQGATVGAWVTAASGPVGQTGEFDAKWRANRSGSLQVRAVLDVGAGTSRRPASRPRSGAPLAELATTPALTLTVYKSAVATIYGPGLFGRTTACGERLTHATLGVASRTLKCGAPVAIYYKGQELVVPVIDRGPYSPDAKWDLTLATAKALGIAETVRIGALSPPPSA
jgi:rare lipoprotein A